MASPPLERRRLTFQGRVQGVGFRATTRDAASGHPITGWVRNEPDGSVLAEAQGTPEALEAFLCDLRTRMSRFITRESSMTIPTVEDESRFDIRR